MNSRKRVMIVFAGIIVVAILACAALVDSIDRLRASYNSDEVMYIPSPVVIKRLSLGQTGLAADIYWTRAVQYFGTHHHNGGTQYNLLYPYLDITTELDPHLLVAYEFGSIFLSQDPPDGAGMPDQAIELVERGIRANPSEWRLYYNLGFIYFDRKDYAAAQRAFDRGAHVPGANPALAVLAAAMAQKGGDRETAQLLWTQLYESSQNETVRENAARHLLALRVQSDMVQLEHVVDMFRERNGRLPSNFEEMVASGWLRSMPIDPTGKPYTLDPNGTIGVQDRHILQYLN